MVARLLQVQVPLWVEGTVRGRTPPGRDNVPLE